MGKILSVASRKLNRFNAENRAHRFLDKEKLNPAPKYESTLKDIERSMEVDPDFLTKQSRKDKSLDERLKQVYVTSENNYIDLDARRQQQHPDRPLPLDRGSIEDFEYGFKEPQRVPIGKCTLRQAMKFISDYQTEPEVWSISKIANEYKVKENNIANILKYFKMFEIYIPDKHKKENILTQFNRKQIKDKDSKEGT